MVRTCSSCSTRLKESRRLLQDVHLRQICCTRIRHGPRVSDNVVACLVIQLRVCQKAKARGRGQDMDCTLRPGPII